MSLSRAMKPAGEKKMRWMESYERETGRRVLAVLLRSRHALEKTPTRISGQVSDLVGPRARRFSPVPLVMLIGVVSITGVVRPFVFSPVFFIL